MSGLVERVLGLPGWLVVLVTAALVFAEDALFVGFVIPGETVALLAGAAARLGHTSLAAVLPTVVVAAIVGDSIGFELGRRIGPRVLRLRLLQRRRGRLDEAEDFWPAEAVAPCSSAAGWSFFRAVMPALAGTARLPYPRFLAWNAAGGRRAAP